ncbi:hypothetical protein KCM76_00770 [Zooshikella marina]|uniref:hypothetical protein n=1 Tax=Zooshikella ganghwensis TaxID=202772 RepID=UPI001BB0C751|nr:hypothetical protein [Zooshikella ganghwensis]MBU2704493.1 hypothetical protein [Zooshikella ganghwensis]
MVIAKCDKRIYTTKNLLEYENIFSVLVTSIVDNVLGKIDEEKDITSGDVERHYQLALLLSYLDIESLKQSLIKQVIPQFVISDKLSKWYYALMYTNIIKMPQVEEIRPVLLSLPIHAHDSFELAVNDCIVRYLMIALKHVIEQKRITSKHAIDICDYIVHIICPKVDKATISTLCRMVGDFYIGQNKTLIYLSIGCGDGQADSRYVKALKARYPDLDLRVVGLEKYISCDKHLFESLFNGKVIYFSDRTDKESYPILACQALGDLDANVLAVERYALHHLGISFECFKTRLEGSPLLSVEEPVNLYERTHLWMRVARIAYDLLINWCFDQYIDQDWISSAVMGPKPKSEKFNVLYRWVEKIPIENTQIKDVYPRTDVIPYHQFVH